MTVTTLTTKIIDFINGTVIYLLFALAFIFFLWGVFKYFILGGASDETREEGKKFIVWGIVALAVMVSVWGLVNLLVDTFGFGGAARPCLPTFGAADCSGGASTKAGTINVGGQAFSTNPNFGNGAEGTAP